MSERALSITQLIVFGDSLSDIGQGYVDGNGPTAVAVMARSWGIDLLPGRMASADCRASRCYAVSGAGSGSAGGSMIKAAIFGRGLLAQISDFAEALQSNMLMIDERTVFFIEIGLNDRDLSSDQVLANCEVAIARLHDLGARRIVVASLPRLSPTHSETARRLNPILSLAAAQASLAHPESRVVINRFGAWFDEIRADPARFGLDNASAPCAPGR